MKLIKKISNKMRTVLIGGMFLLSISTVSFAGHKNYYIKSTIDYSGFGILSEVLTDDGNGGGDTETEYLEEDEGYNFSRVRHYGNISKNNSYIVDDDNTNHLTINFNANRKDPTSRKEQYVNLTKEDDKEIGLVFSFPGLKTNNGGYKATSNDYSRALKVSDTLTIGLNQAILFINNNSQKPLSSVQDLHLLLARLSYTSDVERLGSSGYFIKANNTTFKLTQASEGKDGEMLIPLDGLDYKDYVKISVYKNGENGNGVYSYFPYKMKKGYYPGDEMSEYVGEVYATEAKKGSENEYLSWGQLILQAMLNRDARGTTSEDFASDVQTIIGQGLGSDLTKTISSVRNLLGLSSMSELVLNMGARPANYHHGVMSNSMYDIAITVYTLNLIVSLIFLAFMIIKLIHQKMVATTNVIAKTSLMEGIKDIVFVCVMLAFFAPLFEILLELNFLIVRTFSYSSEYMKSFSALGSKTLSMESMAGFIVSSMFLSIDMYINFVYVVRAITVSFLFAIAPIMMVSYLWSPTQKNMVFGYMRELVGNIFMQSFHAITMTFFTGYNLTNMSTLEAIASAYCFIPITQLFRQLVIGNSGGFSEKVGGKLAGQVGTMTTGMQKASMQAKQSKEMFSAQTKAMVDTEKGKMFGELANTTISGFGKTANAFLTNGGEALGSFGGVGKLLGGDSIGKTAGATLGTAIETGTNVIGSLASSAISINAAKNAQESLGAVNSKHADQTLGMGLAEMGIGLGISSFDGAGDRMVQSGLATVQQGAAMKGRAEAVQGEGGDNMAKAIGYGVAAMGIANTGRNLGHNMNNIAKAWGEERREKLEIDQKVELFNNQTEKVDKLSALDKTLKHEHMLDITQGKDKTSATVHSVFNAEKFRNGDYSHLSSDANSADAKLHEILSMYEEFGKNSKEFKNALEGTVIKDVYENHNTGRYDFIIDAVKTGIRAEEGINMTNGVLDLNNLRVDKVGGHRGL